MPLAEMFWWFNQHCAQIKKEKSGDSSTSLESIAKNWELTRKTKPPADKKKYAGEKSIRNRRMELIEKRSMKK